MFPTRKPDCIASDAGDECRAAATVITRGAGAVAVVTRGGIAVTPAARSSADMGMRPLKSSRHSATFCGRSLSSIFIPHATALRNRSP